MGRYFDGDIEGKFWFAVQGSDVPERFGARICEPTCIEYGFDELEPVKKELAKIKKGLGEKFNILHDVFSKKDSRGYNDKQVQDAFAEKDMEITAKDVRQCISEYADWQFGERVREYMEDEDNPCCYISAKSIIHAFRQSNNIGKDIRVLERRKVK